MNLLRLFRQSLFSPGAACKRTLARNTRRLLPLAAVLLFAATAQAQERRTTHDNDFRARFSFALTKQLGQQHSITLDEELRLKDNWSQLDRIYTTLSYAYDVRPWFKAAAFYALIANDRGADRSMEMRHRFYLELRPATRRGRGISRCANVRRRLSTPPTSIRPSQPKPHGCCATASWRSTP